LNASMEALRADDTVVSELVARVYIACTRVRMPCAKVAVEPDVAPMCACVVWDKGLGGFLFLFLFFCFLSVVVVCTSESVQR
jgi:hypothetical protein